MSVKEMQERLARIAEYCLFGVMRTKYGDRKTNETTPQKKPYAYTPHTH